MADPNDYNVKDFNQMKNAIDHRRHYVIVLDTETANTSKDTKGKLDMTSGLVYDMGWAVVDTAGNTYAERSFVNTDVLMKMWDVMQTAYYVDKLPQYFTGMGDGSRTLATTAEIRKALFADMKLYGITEVCAHNARFDVAVLNSTQRYMTKSKSRYFLPYGTEVWDTMKMARDVIHKMPTYRAFCERHGLFTKTGQLPTTAEALYKFITNDPDFVESHTGLEDVSIEKEILFYCLRQHKPMRKVLYGKKGD